MKKTSFRDILAYATGDGATSIMMNAFYAFAMLYYTDALKLDYKLVGLAFFIAGLWDAVTDPLMGHITDNTKSRFGRRHPYMLVGGLLTVLCFYFLWAVPSAVQTPKALFWYIVAINLLLRTAITAYVVPYGALGFEICTDYNQRTTLQSVRFIFSMAVNLAGIAMAWLIFFKGTPDIKGTSIAANFVNMARAFSIIGIFFVLCVVFLTRKYITDTRTDSALTGNSFADFRRDFKEIILDKYPRMAFLFGFLIQTGYVIVSSLQMYVYVHFMKFSPLETTIVHGATMVGCALGSIASAKIVAKLDKKPTVFIGAAFTIASSLLITCLFVTGLIPTDLTVNLPADLPLAPNLPSLESNLRRKSRRIGRLS